MNILIIKSKFSIGELIHHRLFSYRGVIVDIDSNFQLTDEWYDTVARSRPPKNEPWYHILVHESINLTYVAERNLEHDISGEKINHPLVFKFFKELQDGCYIRDIDIN